MTGEALDVKVPHKVTLLLNRREYSNKFLVRSLLTEASGLLVTNFLEKLGAVIDVENGKISLPDIGRALVEYSGSPAKYTAHTVFPVTNASTAQLQTDGTT